MTGCQYKQNKNKKQNMFKTSSWLQGIQAADASQSQHIPQEYMQRLGSPAMLSDGFGQLCYSTQK